MVVQARRVLELTDSPPVGFSGQRILELTQGAREGSPFYQEAFIAGAIAELFGWGCHTRLRLAEAARSGRFTVIDIETTGLDRAKDLVLQFGYVVVDKGKIIDRGESTLNWFDDDLTDKTWLRERLQQTKHQVEHDRNTGAPNGKWYAFDEAKLRSGVAARPALGLIIDLLEESFQAGFCIVGHNAVGFDLPMISANSARLLQRQLVIKTDQVIDSGLLEKAAAGRLLPLADDNAATWQERVRNARIKGLFWNLEQCVYKYQLYDRAEVDVNAAHTSLIDCLLVYRLLEVFFEMAGRAGVSNS